MNPFHQIELARLNARVRTQEIKRARDQEEREVWIRAWCAVATAWNCKTSEAASRWADEALRDFRERFPR